MIVLSFPSSKVIISLLGAGRDLAAGGACPRACSGLKLARAMPDVTIHAAGIILENLNPVLYRVALPNGKTILAHLSKPLAEAKAVFAPGDRLVLELTAYDFDQARILGIA